MSDENNKDAELQSWIEPDLEARVVAWVLGETSAFEASELTRIIAEKPELGIFKRRMEAVHGLVTSAARMELEPMRMAEERRRKLLERLGGEAGGDAKGVVAMPEVRPRAGWKISRKVMGIAACIALVAILMGLMLPALNSSKSAAKKAYAQNLVNELAAEQKIAQDEPAPIIITSGATTSPDFTQIPATQNQRLAALDSLKALAQRTENLDDDEKNTKAPGMAGDEGKVMTFGGSTVASDLDSNPRYAAKTREPHDAQTGSETDQFERDYSRGDGSAVAASPDLRQNRGIISGNAAAREQDAQQAQQQLADGAGAGTGATSATASLSGANSYTGATTVSGGALALDSASTDATYANSAPVAAPAAPPAPVVATVAKAEPMPEEAAAPAGPAEGQMITQADVESRKQAEAQAERAALSKIADGKVQPVFQDLDVAERPVLKDMPAAATAAAGGQQQNQQQHIAKTYGVSREEDMVAMGGVVANAAGGQTSNGFINYGSPIQPVAPQGLDATAGSAQASSDFQGQVDKSWNPPAHMAGAAAAGRANSAAADSVTGKLNNIIIPKIEFRDATVSEALDFLKAKSRDLDPDRNGVDIAAQPAPPIVTTAPAVAGLEPAPVPSAPASAAPAKDSEARITLSLSNIPLGDALKYVAQLSNQKVTVNSTGVSLTPPSVNTDELITKEYTVSPAVIAGLSGQTGSGTGIVVRQASPDIWTSHGVVFPPGASAEYFPETGRLVMHNTEANIETVDAIVAKAVAPPAPSPQDEISASDQAYSTFSLHVSDVSFLLAKNALANGQLPDPDSIRSEEFYNAFDYGDPAPATNEKIACRIEQAAHPMLQQRNLVRLAMKVAATGRGEGQPLRLTVLLDTSGSMERDDRAASVQRAMKVLTSLLGPNDAVTLIGFARQPRLLAEEVPGTQAGKLVDIVKHTPAEGGTNMEEAIKTASELALRHFAKGGQNRVVMLTDGAANLGDANPAQLSKLVERLRQQGVSFDACGVGADGFNDDILEALTRKGGGRYYFLNQPEDADAGFARQLAGAFRPAAENVKMQVRFNPDRVGKYRLIGFEKHRLNQEDFRNDKVTAAQLAAEEAAVALYQVQVLPEGEGEIGEVFVRFRDPSNGQMVEQSWTIPYDPQAPAFDKASPSMQLAATASLVAEKLRGGPIADGIDLDALAPIVGNLRGVYAQQARVQELATMFEQARRLTARK